jgi:hypothetical protein
MLAATSGAVELKALGQPAEDSTELRRPNHSSSA